MSTLGASILHVGPGVVDIALSPSPSVSQQHGFVHAGAISAIADSAAGYAALSLMPCSAGVLTTEFKINLVAPAAGERIVARGRGRRRDLGVVRTSPLGQKPLQMGEATSSGNGSNSTCHPSDARWCRSPAQRRAFICPALSRFRAESTAGLPRPVQPNAPAQIGGPRPVRMVGLGRGRPAGGLS